MKHLLLFAFYCLTTLECASQHCRTIEDAEVPLPFQIHEYEYKRNNKTSSGLGQRTSDSLTTIFTVPIVIHIIERQLINQSAIEKNLTDDSLLAIINRANKIFNSSYQEDCSIDAANTQIQLCLASLDPDNNPTNGIVRHDGSALSGYETDFSLSNQNETAIKNFTWNATSPNTPRYLNVYLVWKIGGGESGFATIGNSSFVFLEIGEIEDTWVHEIGHAFGLYHTFRGGCEEEDCSTEGDWICDTPPTIQFQSSGTACSPKSPCGIEAQPGNIMDYTSCRYFFTEGQKQRMFAFLHPSINTLSTSNNLGLTGCGTEAPPVAGFIIKKEQVCSSDTVQVLIASTYNNTNQGNIFWSSTSGNLIQSSNPLVGQFNFTQQGIHTIDYLLFNSLGGFTYSIQSPYILNPPIPIIPAADGVIEYGNNVLLVEASDNLSTAWYTDSLASIPFHIGQELFLESLTNDTVFYVENRDTNHYMMIASPSPQEAVIISDYPNIDSIGVEFEILKALTIRSVDVRIVELGFGIKITDSLNNEIAWFPVDLSEKKPGAILTIDMNIELTPGIYHMIKTHNRIGFTDLDIGFVSTTYPIPLGDQLIINKTINNSGPRLPFFSWRISNENIYCASERKKISLNISPVGFAKNNSLSIKVFPNPTSAKINITGLKGITGYSLYNSFGTRVLLSEDNVETFDISTLENGIYFLLVTTYKTQFIFKVIKE